MNRYHVLTLFPEMIENGLRTSITGRAIEQGVIGLNAVNIRDFADNKHNKVDDYPYGGGAGMVMQAEPVYRAWASVTEKIGKKARTIYVTPQGTTFHQGMAEELAKEEDVIFLCGHYEGIDERVLTEVVTDYVSIGDYVLTGGEFPAMVMIDAISRLVPGVLNNEVSAEFESFQDGLLEYPQYSRPEVWHDKEVPPVLLSGNHTNIEGWRQELSILRTKERRPDLYETYQKEQALSQPDKKKRFRGVLFDLDSCLARQESYVKEILDLAGEKKMKTGVFSSLEEQEASGLLSKLGIEEQVDFRICGKNSETFRKALKKGRLKPSGTLVFAGSPEMVEAARSLKLRTVYLPDREAGAKEPGTDYYRKIGDLAEGMAILRALS